MKNLISVNDLNPHTLTSLLEDSKNFKVGKKTIKPISKILASCFWEPSTRTRLSFESAMLRLGGQTLGFSDVNHSSKAKGEGFEDFIKSVENYADVLVIRHPENFSALKATNITHLPVINAGDGHNEHPTQALIDLFSIYECQPDIKNLKIGFVGDIERARTVNSLVKLLGLMKHEMHFVTNAQRRVYPSFCSYLDNIGAHYFFHSSLQDTISNLDILYVTRLQKERYENDLDKTPDTKSIITPELLKLAKDNFKILHPLPRNQELPTWLDNTHFAYYFQQMSNGLWLRMAILNKILKH